MATVNKDFKIKQGLVVEGATGTINGENILTEGAGDAYILDLIGGETLITSVSSQFDVTAGELSLDRTVVDAYYDAAGAADAVQGNLDDHATDTSTHGVSGAIVGTTDAQTLTNKTLTDPVINISVSGLPISVSNEGLTYLGGLTGNVQNQLDNKLEAADIADFATETYVNDAVSTEATDRGIAITNAINTEVTNRDAAIDVAINNEVTARNTAIATAKGEAEDYTDTAVANLVDGAPALLDTLNELAAALQDNPDIIADLQDVAAGKQDTLTAGSNIDITGATISVTGLDTEDVAEAPAGPLYFTNQRALDATASAYDAAGSASAAQTAAQSYADGLAVNYDAAGAASTAESNAATYTDNAINALDTDDIEEGATNLYFTDGRAKSSAADLLTSATLTNITITGTGAGLTITAENGVADSTTDDLDEGSTNLYFTDSRAIGAVSGADITPNTVRIDTYRKEEATQQSVNATSTVNVHSFQYPYESAKYLVRVVGWDGGVKHSQITEILMTVDGNNNIAMTEYGNVHTSTNPLASFSATNVLGVTTLTATTAVSGCEIIAAATLLSWAD